MTEANPCELDSDTRKRLHRMLRRNTETLCLEFQGAVNANGACVFKYRGQTRSVPRLWWEHHFGPIPEGQWLRKREECRSSRCACLDHHYLYLPTTRPSA